MMRNDYRRSLILLRSNASGYSGHVRLERRTLMGTMYFQVQSPGDCPALRAALVGRGRDGGYYACALGELQQDARGQAVLGYSFDPRDICKRELEQYQLIAITCAGDASCQVALFGNVCGHAELNWEAVRAALCELYAGERAEDGAGEAAVAPPDAGAQSAPVTELPEPQPGTASVGDASPFAAGAGDGARQAQAEALEEISEAAPAEAAQAEAAEPAADPAMYDAAGGAAAQLDAAQTGDSQPGGALACDLLEAEGFSASAPWPGAAEALRPLFQSEPALSEAPDDQCVYVEAPMPSGSGFPFVAAGLLILGGALAAIRYALPAAWSEEPPAGLEDCAWIGDQNKGWWVTEVPLEG